MLAWWCFTPYTWLISITLLPWLPSFPPQAFPTTVSSLPSPPSVSPQSTAALALWSLHTPQIPAPSRFTFQGTLIPVRGRYGCLKDCLILIPCRLPQISCFTLSLKCFSSDSDSCWVGIGPLFQFPHPPRAGPVLLTLLFFPLVPCSTKFCAVLYILFLWSGTPVRSQLVFCMHFCVQTRIPDVSVERDVLHVYLLLRHLVLYFTIFDGTGFFLSEISSVSVVWGISVYYLVLIFISYQK